MYGWFVLLCTEQMALRSTGKGEADTDGGHSTARDSQAGRTFHT